MGWLIASKGRFYEANEETVVYFDSRSGDTHLLSEFAAFILHQFEERPLTVDSLIEKISPAIPPESLSETRATVPDILAELVALGILKRI